MHDTLVERQEREFGTAEVTTGGQTMNPATLVTPTARYPAAICIQDNRTSAAGTNSKDTRPKDRNHDRLQHRDM